MQDFIYFLGRFHVLALHLPIGIVLVAVALDWIARSERYRGLAAVSPFLWGAAALSAVVTVVLGYMHFAEGAFTGPSASAHRLFGTTVAVASVAIWWLSRHPGLYRRLNVVTGIAALALVAVTGHFGGDLTHGSTFLWEYAPGPLRSLAGVGARRPAVTSVAAADPYLDVVKPMLERRCGGCHNADKVESGFQVTTYESTLAGGDSGRAIVPGKSGSSEIYRRISLARDDEEFMPAEGKTPLTPAQVEIIRWWIDSGTPHDVAASTVAVDPAVEPLLAAELGLSGTSTVADQAVAATAVDPQLVQRLYGQGYLVRQVSQTDSQLIVSTYSPGTRIDSERFAVLLTDADQIVELNLQDAELDDAVLAEIGKFTQLARLRLSHNEITDRTVSTLASMPRLERLNLYANAGVTDASIDVLAGIESLRRVDLWETGITEAGIARLREQRPDVDVQGATSRRITAVGPPPVSSGTN